MLRPQCCYACQVQAAAGGNCAHGVTQNAGQLRDPTAPADQAWLAERFKVAARKRFQGLLTATSMQVPHSPHVPHSADRRGLLVNMQDSQAAINAYST